MARGRRPRPAHPRACGENLLLLSRIARPAGSSPRVRGKPAPPVADRPAGGLIPARAGKTGGLGRSSGVCGAHPRVCGENSSHACTDGCPPGSSPRVRGKLVEPHQRRVRVRLIPACAGKTAWSPSNSRGGTAHPRVCGENSTISASSRSARGSSPRVRGKLAGMGDVVEASGLIPARAGKTTTCAWHSSNWWAHPRVCGENLKNNSMNAATAGSSPRVRGKPQSTRYRCGGLGLIPACAGKTPSCLPS